MSSKSVIVRSCLKKPVNQSIKATGVKINSYRKVFGYVNVSVQLQNCVLGPLSTPFWKHVYYRACGQPGNCANALAGGGLVNPRRELLAHGPMLSRTGVRALPLPGRELAALLGQEEALTLTVSKE